MGLYQGNLWNTEAYLKKLSLPKEGPSLGYLDRLTASHLRTVPFEDLDLSLGHRQISLDVDDLFQKIILGRRGGYCFENNKLFCLLLQALGFDAYPCCCRVRMNREEIRPVSHRATIVRIDGKKYFCDVGFGNSMCPGALELVPGKYQKIGEIYYRFLPFEEGWLELARTLPHKAEKPLLLVCSARMDEVDFLRPNESTSSADSRFSLHIMVGRLTEEGSIGIFDKRFTRTAGGKKESFAITGHQELMSLLEKEFGIIFR